MLKNYLLIAVRNFWRRRGFLFVNVGGLALGMAAFLFIIAFVNFELSYDRFHRDVDRLYRVSVDVYKNGAFELSDAECYNLAGVTMQQEFEEVEDFANVRGLYTYSVSYGDKLFKEDRVLFAEPKFLELFDFRITKGAVKGVLEKPDEVVLTKSVADKIFGETDPIGKQIVLNGKRSVMVTAVMQDVPANSHIHFDLLVSYKTAQAMNPNSNWFPNWNGNNGFTYVLLREGADVRALIDKLMPFSKKYLVNRDERLVLQPVADIHLHSHKTFEIEPNRNGKAVKLMLAIGFIILIIAWVNYINLATARSVERAREVGIRKSLGSLKSQLVRQFMIESLIVNLLALAVAVLVADLSYPLVASITGADQISWHLDTDLWLYALAFFVTGTALSGFYPAWVLSSFRPALILKGKFAQSKKGSMLRKALVVGQFVVSFGLIAGTLAIYFQLDYMRKKDIGMNLNKVLVLHSPRSVPDSLKYTTARTFRDAVLALPFVRGVGISESIPGNGTGDLNSGSGHISRFDAHDINTPVYYHYRVNETYFQTLNIRLLAGQYFSDKVEANNGKILINEDALQKLEFSNAEEAVGARIYWSEARFEIIGVVQNHNHLSLANNYIPLAYFYEPDLGSYFTIRISTAGESLDKSVDELRMKWKESFGDAVFEYSYLDERFNAQYRSDEQFSQLFTVFTVLAVFIACLGLLGLSAYAVVQRTKEIGIRKVLGASATQIVATLSSDFMKLVLVAIGISMCCSLWAINAWLDSYAFRIQLNWWMMTIPAVALMVIALATIGYHTVKAASANPVDSLRTE